MMSIENILLEELTLGACQYLHEELGMTFAINDGEVKGVNKE